MSGPENTIDHFAVLAQAGHEWSEAADLPPGSYSVKLSQVQTPEEPTALFDDFEAIIQSPTTRFSKIVRYEKGTGFFGNSGKDP